MVSSPANTYPVIVVVTGVLFDGGSLNIPYFFILWAFSLPFSFGFSCCSDECLENILSAANEIQTFQQLKASWIFISHYQVLLLSFYFFLSSPSYNCIFEQSFKIECSFLGASQIFLVTKYWMKRIWIFFFFLKRKDKWSYSWSSYF